MKKHLKRSSAKTRRADVSRFVAEAQRRGYASPSQWASLENMGKEWKAVAENYKVIIGENLAWQEAARASMRRWLCIKLSDVPGQLAARAEFIGFCGVIEKDLPKTDLVTEINKPESERWTMEHVSEEDHGS